MAALAPVVLVACHPRCSRSSIGDELDPAAAPLESELPHLALAEFRPEHTVAYLQTFRPVLLLVLLTR
jgi:hypothetical protein